MNNWILSIGSLIILTTVISMLLPEGKISKHIKAVFGLIIVLVMLQPVFTLKNGEFTFNFSDVESQITFQQDYLDYIGNEKIINMEENCEQILLKNGFKNAEVSIDYNIDELGQANIKKVIVDFKKVVIISGERHIDIIEDIVSPICKYLNIAEECVDVVE